LQFKFYLVIEIQVGTRKNGTAKDLAAASFRKAALLCYYLLQKII